ncbi:hypothetical protein J6590_030417 [Homalodisca vitripennis]|nr:hypothetical protein J6590_030417 [Homalodisca vitripennis]
MRGSRGGTRYNGGSGLKGQPLFYHDRDIISPDCAPLGRALSQSPANEFTPGPFRMTPMGHLLVKLDTPASLRGYPLCPRQGFAKQYDKQIFRRRKGSIPRLEISTIDHNRKALQKDFDPFCVY